MSFGGSYGVAPVSGIGQSAGAAPSREWGSEPSCTWTTATTTTGPRRPPPPNIQHHSKNHNEPPLTFLPTARFPAQHFSHLQHFSHRHDSLLHQSRCCHSLCYCPFFVPFRLNCHAMLRPPVSVVFVVVACILFCGSPINPRIFVQMFGDFRQVGHVHPNSLQQSRSHRGGVHCARIGIGEKLGEHGIRRRRIGDTIIVRPFIRVVDVRFGVLRVRRLAQ